MFEFRVHWGRNRSENDNQKVAAARPYRRAVALLSLFALFALVATACGEQGKRKLGGSCGNDAECDAGLCGAGICLDPDADADTDGIINAIEVQLGSDPTRADTDSDGVGDGDEIDDLANVDTDGDGKPDIIESAIDDQDGDCIPDQYDAEDSVQNGDLSPMIDVVCAQSGVCAGQRALLTVVCPEGRATCVYGAVAGYANPEVTCDGLDQNCDGVNDDGFPDRDSDAIADCVDDDWDNDGVVDGSDVCPRVPDPDQADSDGDGIGDACVADYALMFVAAPTEAKVGVTFEAAVGITTNGAPDGAPLPPFRGAVVLALEAGDAALTLVGSTTANAGSDSVARFGGLGVSAPGEGLVLVASSGALGVGRSAGFDATSGALVRFAIEGLPETVAAGALAPFTIVPLDADDHEILDYAGTVRLSATDPDARADGELFLDGLEVTLAEAPAAVVFVRAGDQSIAVIEVDGTATGQATTAVSAGAADHLGLQFIDDAVSAGEPFPVEVSALDPFGNVDPTYTGRVTLTADEVMATLPAPHTFGVSDAGRFTFEGLTLLNAGDHVIQASDGTRTGQEAIGVIAGAVAQIVVVDAPTAVVAGSPFAVTIELRDLHGNLVSDIERDLRVESSDGLDQRLTVATARAVIGDLVLTLAGPQRLTVTELADANSDHVDIVVSAAAASRIALNAPATGVAGTPHSAEVTAWDAFDNVASGYRGTVTFATSDPRGTAPAAVTFGVGDAGQRTIDGFIGRSAGLATLSASDATAGLSDTATVTYAAAPASRLALTGLPDEAVAGLSLSPTVTAYDAYDNIVFGYAGTVALTSDDSQATYPSAHAYVASNAGAFTFDALVLRTSGRVTVTARAGPLSIALSLDVTPSVATHLDVVLGDVTLAAGVATNVTLTARDAFDNIASGYVGTVGFSATDATATLPADVAFVAGDAGSVTRSGIVFRKVGAHSLSATDRASASITGSDTITIVAGADLRYLLVAPPTTRIAGEVFALTVRVEDSFGNLATSYLGKARFTSDDTQAVLPAEYTFKLADGGVHTFSGLALKTAGDQTVRVTASADARVTASAIIDIAPAAIASLDLGCTPASVVAGVAASCEIRALDAFANTATGHVGVLTFSATDGAASLPTSVAFSVADAGVINVAGITFKTAGAATLTVNADAVTAQAGFDVTPAAPSKLALTGLPASLVAGASQPLTLTASDAFGNVASNYTGAVTLTSSDPQATLPAVTLAGGVASFNVSFATSGTQTLTCNGGGALVAQGSTSVGPAVATTLELAALPAGLVAGAVHSAALTLRDAAGNIASDFAGTVAITSSDPLVVVPASVTLTAADLGQKSFNVSFGTAGNQSLTVTTGVAMTATRSTTIAPAAASKLTLTGLPGNVTAGVAQTVTATLHDAFDNLATTFSGSVAVTSTDPAATFTTPLVFTNQATRTLSVTFATVGSRAVTFNAGAGALTQSATTTVGAATGASFSLSALPGSVAAGSSHDLTINVADAFGNPASGYAGTFGVTCSDPLATCPATVAVSAGTATFTVTLKTAGAQTVTVTNALGTKQASTTVNPGTTPATLTLTGLPANVTAGTATTLTVTLKDSFGNVATGYSGTVTTTSSDPAATLPATVVFANQGTKTFSATLKTVAARTVTATLGALQDTQSATVGAAVAARFELVDPVAAFTAGTAASLTVIARDAFDNIATGFAGTVPLSEDDPNAAAVVPASIVFVAGDNGQKSFLLTLLTVPSVTIGTTHAGLGNDTTIVTVVPASASKLTLTGLGANVTAGVSQTLTATVRDAYDNLATTFSGNAVVTSSDASAVFTTPLVFANQAVKTLAVTFKTSGSRGVTVNAGSGALTQTATTTVGAATASTFGISALPAAVAAGTSHNITITVVDAYGNLATGYSGTFNVTCSDVAATCPATATATAGTATFAVILRTSGTQTVTVANALGSQQTSATVNPSSTATTLTLAGMPANLTAGTLTKLTITMRDSFNNIVTNYSGTIALTSTDPAATLPATVVLTNEGTKTFDVTLKTVGARTVTASAGGALQDTESTTVTPAGAVRFEWVDPPAAFTAGIAGNVTLTARDAYDNVAAGFTGAVPITENDPNAAAVIPTSIAFAAGDLGVKTFSVTLITAPSVTLGSNHGTLTNDTTVVAVNAAAAAKLLYTDPAAFTAGAAGNITLTVQDSFGNTARTFTGPVTITETDPSASAIIPTSVAFAPGDNGVKTFSVTLITAPSVTLGTVHATLTADTTLVTVNAAAAAKLLYTDPAAAFTAGVAGNITLTVQDTYGNVAKAFAGIVTLTENDPSASAVIPASITFAALDNGVRTFSVTLITAPSVTLGTSHATLTVDTTVVTVNAAAAAKLNFTDPVTAFTAGVAGNITLTVQDTYGNTAKTFVGSIPITENDPSASAVVPTPVTFDLADNGVKTFSVTLITAPTVTLGTNHGTLTADTTVVSINAATATRLLFTDPAAFTAGVAGNITLTVQDTYGNTARAFTGTVPITENDRSASAVVPASVTYIAADNGVRTFSVTLISAPSVTLGTNHATLADDTTLVTVNAAAAAKVFYTDPPTAFTAGIAGNVTLTVTDTYGNTATTFTGAVPITENDPNAAAVVPASITYVAGDKGVRTFSVTLITAPTVTLGTNDATLTADTTVVTVNAAAPAKLSFTDPVAAFTAGVAGTLTLTVQDTYGNTARTFVGSIPITENDPNPAAVVTTPVTFVAADNGVRTFSATLITAPSVTLATNHGTLTNDTTLVTINHTTAVKLAWKTQPPTGTTGVALSANPVVEVQDTYGNRALSVAATTITLTLTTNPGRARLAGNAVATSSGQATFTALTLDQPATGYILTARGGSFTAAASSTFNITWATPSLTTGTPNLSGTCVDVAFDIAQAASAPVDLKLTYDIIGDSPNLGFVTATQAGAPLPVLASDIFGVKNLPTTATATARKIRWDAYADLGTFAPTSVALRLTASINGAVPTTRTLSASYAYDAAWTAVPVQTAINGIGPTASASGDFNNDGRPDLAVARGTFAGFSLYLSRPNMTYTQQNFTWVGITPGNITSVAAVDLPRSGGNWQGSNAIPDLVFGDAAKDAVYIVHLSLSNATTVAADAPVLVKGPNDSTDPNPCASASGLRIVDIAAGPLDSDGPPELAIACSARATVAIANFDGTDWRVTTRLATVFAPSALAIGDLDRDGKRDLIAVGAVVAGRKLASFLNNGDTLQKLDDITIVGSVAPTDVTLGDLDDDGDLDALVADATTSLYLLPGDVKRDANGAVVSLLAAAKAVATTHPHSAVAIADMDRDGRPDIVAGSRTADFVSILRSLDWAAATPTVVATNIGLVPVTNGGPVGVHVGDVDGDGWLDVLVARADINTATDSVATLRGIGRAACDGHFEGAGRGPRPVNSVVRSRAVDLNRDGKLDLLGESSNGIEALYGLGNGRFAVDPVSISGGPIAPATGDFNGDGKLDIAARNASTGALTLQLQGANAFTFTPFTGTQDFKPNVTSGPFVADFDLDGRDDIAYITTNPASPTAAGNLYIHRQTSAGVFAQAGNIATTSPSGIAGSDVNGDGITDFAFTRISAGVPALCVALSTGVSPATWVITVGASTCATLEVRSVSEGTLQFATIDSDAVPEIVLVNMAAGGSRAFQVVRQTTVGSGLFNLFEDDTAPGTNPKGWPLCTSWQGITLGEFNGATGTDVAYSCNSSAFQNGVEVRYRSANSYPAAASAVVGGGDSSNFIANGDFDGDFANDLVHALSVTPHASTASGFDEPAFTQIVSTLPNGRVVADLNADGRADVAMIASSLGSTDVTWVLQTRPSGMGTVSAITTNLIGLKLIASGDTNGDGRQDLVVAYVDPGKVSGIGFLEQTGAAGNFALARTRTFINSTYVTTSLVVSDVDGDGLDDVVVANTAGTAPDFIGIFRQTAPGVFSDTTDVRATLAAAEDIRAMAVGDFDRPGFGTVLTLANRQGIASYGHCASLSTTCVRTFGLDRDASGKLSMPQFVAFAAVSAVGGGTPVVTTGDVNRDALDDIVMVDSGLEVVAWLQASGALSYSEKQGGVLTGNSPMQIALADVDRDGQVDVLVNELGSGYHDGIEVIRQVASGFVLDSEAAFESFGRDAVLDFLVTDFLAIGKPSLLGFTAALGGNGTAVYGVRIKR